MDDANSSAFYDSLSDSFAESLSANKTDKQPKIVTCSVEEVLLPEHIAAYAEGHGDLSTTVKAEEKDVRLLRARHHSVARLLAQGVPEGIIAEFTGYTQGYISVLKGSPAMVELVQHYRVAPNSAAIQIGERLRELASMATERLVERLEEDALDNNELISTAKLGLDRVGHGPQSKVHNVTEHRIIDLAELERLNREARERDSFRIVNPEDVRAALPAPKPDGDK